MERGKIKKIKEIIIGHREQMFSPLRDHNRAFAPPNMGAKASAYQHMETSRVYIDIFI